MRKNGVNRELCEIEGGVCAPVGFCANGLYVGFSEMENKKDLGLIVAERRCPAACVYAAHSIHSGPTSTTKRHMKRGLARAILVNGGFANVFLPEGERLAEMACRALAARSNVDCNDTIITSTGKIGREIALETFEKGLKPLVQGLTNTDGGSLCVAEVLAPSGSDPMQAAFSFDLGAFPCKVGVVFGGDTRECADGTATLIFITTDVNISSEMLQKALSLTVKDTVELLCYDGEPSPNDMVCIMANGKAGNYKISCEDTEYSKFSYALRKVLTEVCRRLAKSRDKCGRVFTCKVTGAKSQQAARTAVKTLASSARIRRAIVQGAYDIAGILYAINTAMETTDYTSVTVTLTGNKGSYVFYDGGMALPIDTAVLRQVAEGEEVILRVDVNEGNYTATAFGCLDFA